MSLVFFDVDTQLDFLSPAGALYVPGAEQIAPALAALTTVAAEKKVQIVSTLDSHTENDPEFEFWRPHCIIGTQGCQKWSGTMLGHGSDRQILFEKNTIDFFSDGNLQRLLDRLDPRHFVVYGLVTEYCIRSAIFGLLARRARVDLVTDAIKSLSPANGHEVLERFRSEGGRLTTARDVLSQTTA